MKKTQLALLMLLTLASAFTVGCGDDSHLPVFKQLAFISNRTTSPTTDLFLMSTAGSNVTPIPFSTTDVWSPSTSANLKTVVFSSQGNVWVSNADGSVQTQLTTTGEGYSTKISPDGTKILYNEYDQSSSDYNLWIMNVDGTNAHNLTASMTSSSVGCYSGSFSADSKKIVFSCYSNESTSIYTMKLDGTAMVTVFTQPEYCDTPVFSPTGKQIFFASYGVIAPNGKKRKLAPAHFGAHRLASKDSPSTTYGVVSINSDGSNLKVLSVGSYEVEVLNSTLYYSLYNSDLGNSQVYMSNLDGSKAVALTDGTTDDYIGVYTD